MPELYAVELKEVKATSGGFEVLSSASVGFPQGICSVVMGQAGSGKSTLLKVAAGLVQADSGYVLWQGKDLSALGRKDELEFRSKSGFAFQDAALWADTSILRNVIMPLRIHKPWMGDSLMAQKAADLLKKLGYRESLALRPAELSIGEQKIASIARAVIHDPEILFMDDPTSSLDEDAVDSLFAFLEDFNARHKTVIIIANSSELAYRFADRLGIIKNGSMMAFGTYDETLESVEEAFYGSIARLKARGTRKKAGKYVNGPGDSGWSEA